MDAFDFLPDRLGVDPRSLKRAAQYFGLDHTRTADLLLLAQVMAEELFGSRAKGRRKGKKTWTEARIFELGLRRYELKS